MLFIPFLFADLNVLMLQWTVTFVSSDYRSPDLTTGGMPLVALNINIYATFIRPPLLWLFISNQFQWSDTMGSKTLAFMCNQFTYMVKLRAGKCKKWIHRKDYFSFSVWMEIYSLLCREIFYKIFAKMRSFVMRNRWISFVCLTGIVSFMEIVLVNPTNM